jgi:hypothetical protein
MNRHLSFPWEPPPRQPSPRRRASPHPAAAPALTPPPRQPSPRPSPGGRGRREHRRIVGENPQRVQRRSSFRALTFSNSHFSLSFTVRRLSPFAVFHRSPSFTVRRLSPFAVLHRSPSFTLLPPGEGPGMRVIAPPPRLSRCSPVLPITSRTYYHRPSSVMVTKRADETLPLRNEEP